MTSSKRDGSGLWISFLSRTTFIRELTRGKNIMLLPEEEAFLKESLGKYAYVEVQLWDNLNLL